MPPASKRTSRASSADARRLALGVLLFGTSLRATPLRAQPSADSLVIVDPSLAPNDGSQAVARATPTPPRFAAGHAPRTVAALGVRSRLPGSLVEGLDLGDVEALGRLIAALAVTRE
jgi:hypothetical protein